MEPRYDETMELDGQNRLRVRVDPVGALDNRGPLRVRTGQGVRIVDGELRVELADLVGKQFRQTDGVLELVPLTPVQKAGTSPTASDVGTVLDNLIDALIERGWIQAEQG